MTDTTFQIRWKNGTHSPELTRKINDAMEPSIKSLMKAAENRTLQGYGVTPEIVRDFCVNKIRFGWKTQTRTSQNHATAYGRPDRNGIYRIMYNPISLLEWLRDYSPELLELRLIDIMMHEIAHILVAHFMKHPHGRPARGHGYEWKLWAQLAGFVPFSGTSNHKRNIQAVALHAQHRGGSRDVEVPAPKKRGHRFTEDLPLGDDVFVPAPPFRFVAGPPPTMGWRVGDRAEFIAAHGIPKQGTAIRVNRKSISIQVDGEEYGRYWRVSPGLLRKLESAIIGEPIPAPKPAPEITPPQTTGDWAMGHRKPADLVRAGILAGLDNPEIVKVLRATFPAYKAYKIACSVYRRELRKKGEIA